MFRFIHCADLHLDSPLRGIAAREDLPTEEIRLAARKALENLVELCISEAVDFVVIAGDVYDGDWQDYSTGLFFNKCMNRLMEHGIPVYLIRGNHDAQSQITKRLKLPENVYEFPVQKPGTVKIDKLQVAIHGQGYKEREVWDNLAIHYPEPVPGYFNIGLLHTSLEGQEGHERYAPTRIDELVQKGYDYWALGHIHKRQIIKEDPYIIFPGNIQGRHIRETGNKGCTLVTVNGNDISVEHRNLDVLRWYLCKVDLTNIETDFDFAGKIEEEFTKVMEDNPGYPLAVRVELSGRTPFHNELIQNRERFINEIINAANMVGGQIWIEKVQFHTSWDTEMIDTSKRKDAISTFFNHSIVENLDDDFKMELLQDFKSIQNRMGAYTKREEATRIESVEELDEVLKEAQDLLLTMLIKGGSK